MWCDGSPPGPSARKNVFFRARTFTVMSVICAGRRCRRRAHDQLGREEEFRFGYVPTPDEADEHLDDRRWDAFGGLSDAGERRVEELQWQGIVVAHDRQVGGDLQSCPTGG